MDFQTTLNRLYQNFNERDMNAVLADFHADVTWPNGWEGGVLHGQEEVRAYWLRQWQEINPKVLPVTFKTRPDGEVAVNVHQVIKALDGQLLSDSHVTHIYTFDEGKVRKMVIEKAEL